MLWLVSVGNVSGDRRDKIHSVLLLLLKSNEGLVLGEQVAERPVIAEHGSTFDRLERGLDRS